MANERTPNHPTTYEIKIKGHLSQQWEDWFGGVTAAPDEEGNTVLTCPVIDQAQLYGLLRKVRDLGVPLISVTRLDPDDGDTSESNSPT